MVYKVLLADDEQGLRDITKKYLERNGFDVITAKNGAEAIAAVDKNVFDIIVLDIMMPEIDGRQVCQYIRTKYDVPVIFLTALGKEQDVIQGYEIGADEYVTKPFSNRELVARVKANLRRQEAAAAPAAEAQNADIQVGDLTIHPDAYTVTKRGENINLTHREFELLYYLAQHIGQVINREHLLQTVWGYDYFGDVRTVDVTVRRLREKIEDNPSHPQWLITRRGVGYYLANPSQN